jgi:hypothetical protein
MLKAFISSSFKFSIHVIYIFFSSRMQLQYQLDTL